MEILGMLRSIIQFNINTKEKKNIYPYSQVENSINVIN